MCVFWLFCIDALGLDSHGARISVISFRRSSSCWGVWLGGTRNLGLEGFREGSKVQKCSMFCPGLLSKTRAAGNMGPIIYGHFAWRPDK
jgi:hypothetical protein